MKNLIAVLACLSFAIAASAQVAPNQPFPDQFVSAGISYDQASVPAVSGFVAYAKLADKAHGAYSYTLIRETSIKLKPTATVETQTETGACLYTTKFGAFDVFSCGTGGLATGGGNTGFSASGTLLITKALSKGWTIGVAGGPSYSGVAAKVSYPISLVFGWGK